MIGFEPNHAYFNIIVLAFDLYEAFKANLLPDGVLSEGDCMPTTFRRKLLDVTGKVVETSNYIYLKVTEAVYERLKLDEIWSRANSPPLPSLI